MWKKKKVKRVEKAEEIKETKLLKTLCGYESELYGFASNYLCINPLTAISTKILDSVMEEGSQNGDYRPALDKAIFEAAQHPEETANYMNIIQDIAGKNVAATEKEKGEIERQGLPERTAFPAKQIADQKLIQNRAADILKIPSKYYRERMLELGEDAKREERVAERKQVERDEWRAEQAE